MNSPTASPTRATSTASQPSSWPTERRATRNPVETLWHYLRRLLWSNRVHEEWNALMEAAWTTLFAVGTNAERIKSACVAPDLEW
ncbi:hypothetical protein [Singulisphaera acidiphila]|uniref:hypothetical protein n=1 Tax=Singulisphaera acidiphila TaxID=466153 RepID=UPI0012B5BA96|nr:hypothetical protein [Singulisphaera acidiphila]